MTKIEMFHKFARAYNILARLKYMEMRLTNAITAAAPCEHLSQAVNQDFLEIPQLLVSASDNIQELGYFLSAVRRILLRLDGYRDSELLNIPDESYMQWVAELNGSPWCLPKLSEEQMARWILGGYYQEMKRTRQHNIHEEVVSALGINFEEIACDTFVIWKPYEVNNATIEDIKSNPMRYTHSAIFVKATFTNDMFPEVDRVFLVEPKPVITYDYTETSNVI